MVEGDTQSRILPDSDRIRVSIVTEGQQLVTTPGDGVVTLYDVIQRGAKVSENGECLGERDEKGRRRYGWLRYQEVINRAHRIGSALLKLGYHPGEGTKVGVCGINCPEWVIASYACISFNMVLVPLYHNYHEEALEFIMDQCQLEVVFCDSKERISNLLKIIGSSSKLKTIVLMRGVLEDNSAIEAQAADVNAEVFTMDYLLRLGDANLKPVQPPMPEDLYIICYTSGTTGPPKGVMLTHKAIVGSLAAVLYFWEKSGVFFDVNDTHCSFLPLAHIYEQMMEASLLFLGCRVGFYSGDTTKLLDDMQELKPTVVAMVPRLLNRLKNRIETGAASAGFLKKFLFGKALQAKYQLLDKGQVTNTTIWDKFVFKSVQQLLGGKLKLVITGGAPIAPEVLRFCRAVFGCRFVEGYGQTECSAAATLTLPDDIRGGHVGGPAPWCHIKLADVPDMEYFAKDDKGEVLIRGVALMKGYFGNKEATEETLDEDGWLHTGDVGMWQPNGGLKIIDRKKMFFKLAQGDYVSPEVVEGVYDFCPLVSQIYVAGLPLKSCLVAVVVAELDELRSSIKSLGLPEEEILSDEKLLAHRQVRLHVLSELRILGASKGLNNLEQVRAVHLTDADFTNENGLLTPTMKLRRVALKKKYADIVEQLYSEVEK